MIVYRSMIYLQSSSIIPRFEAETVREPAMGHICMAELWPITNGPYSAHCAEASADFTGTMPIVGRKRRAVWDMRILYVSWLETRYM